MSVLLNNLRKLPQVHNHFAASRNCDQCSIHLVNRHFTLPASKYYAPKSILSSSGQVALLAGASSRTPEDCVFDRQSGHTPKLQVWSPVGACIRGNWSVFSLKSINIPLGEDLKKNQYSSSKSLCSVNHIIIV